MNEVCQQYAYNASDLNVVKEGEKYFSENFKVKSLKNSHTHWLNFHSIENREEIESFMENQDFHRLTIEDVFTEKHHPKLEEFDDYIFFSIQSALPTGLETWSLKQEQISFILGKRYLISIQERKSDHFPDVRYRLENKIGKIRDKGPDFLLFKMLDAIVDNYFEVLEQISSVIRDLEMTVFKHTSEKKLKEIEVNRRKLIELRRIVIPLKDIALQLEKDSSTFIAQDNLHYYSDLKDNCLSILDDVDSNKNILEGLTNLYYAAQGQRMNEIMKLLTIVSTIFIPLTFIVGVYGMNFEVMPELKMEYGYYLVWFLMIIIAVLLWFYFRSKGWLKDK